MPHVSVVMPTHDRATLVLRAARSVLSQTVEDVELIVVDDGSSDATPELLADLARTDARVRVIRVDQPQGAPAARNAGLAVAASELVAFLDDDDEWLPTKLERQIEFLDDHPDMALVGCHHLLVASDGEAVYRGPVEWSAPALLWCNFLGSASFVLARRPPSFDPSFPACQDWDVWVRASGPGEAAVVPEVLCRYSDEGSDRLTAAAPGRLAGYARFAERHGPSMSPACRAYHRARRLLLHARAGTDNAIAAARIVTSVPPRVSLILAREIAAARAGERDGDPGRGMRTLAEQVAQAS